jgi:glycine cleavage system aminomethyltransferase T
VERIRSRGSVHRKFTGFLLEGPVAIKIDEKITSGDKEVGEITSVALLPNASGNRTVALGYIRREVGVHGRTVSISGIPATVVALPLEESLPRQAQESLLQQQ